MDPAHNDPYRNRENAMAERRGRGEGSVTQLRKKGVDGAKTDRWLGRVTIAPGVRRTVYGATKGECLTAMRKAASKADSGLPQGDNRTTVATFLREWLNGPAQRSVRPSTFTSYRRYVELHLIPHIGRHRLVRLRPEHIDAMLDDLAKRENPLSPRSRLHARAVLRTALAWGERNGRVARNVAKLSTPPRAERHEFRGLTPEEARSIVGAATDDPWGALYVLALDTGLRQGECSASDGPMSTATTAPSA